MNLRYQHGITKAEAIKIIDSFLNELMKWEFPGGVKVKNAKKEWHGDIMEFSFTVRKGIAWTTIKGFIRVFDTTVCLTSELTAVARTFVSEDKVKNAIDRQVKKLFPNTVQV